MVAAIISVIPGKKIVVQPVYFLIPDEDKNVGRYRRWNLFPCNHFLKFFILPEGFEIRVRF